MAGKRQGLSPAPALSCREGLAGDPGWPHTGGSALNLLLGAWDLAPKPFPKTRKWQTHKDICFSRVGWSNESVRSCLVLQIYIMEICIVEHHVRKGAGSENGARSTEDKGVFNIKCAIGSNFKSSPKYFCAAQLIPPWKCSDLAPCYQFYSSILRVKRGAVAPSSSLPSGFSEGKWHKQELSPKAAFLCHCSAPIAG